MAGRIEGIRRASIVLPVPGAPSSSRLCPPAAAISSAQQRRGVAPDVGQVGLGHRGGRLGRRRRAAAAARLRASTSAAIAQARDAGDLQPVDQRRLAGPLARARSAAEPGAARALGDRQRTGRVAQLAAQRQLTEHRAATRAPSAGPGRSPRARRARAPRRTPGPTLRRNAGARLAVMRVCGELEAAS